MQSSRVLHTSSGLVSITLLTLLFLCGTLRADDNNCEFLDRHLNRPIFRPQSSISSAKITQLFFHQDHDRSLWLYSAGEDKVVRKWKVNLTDRGSVELESRETIRWPISNSYLGTILGMDYHPGIRGKPLLAFGGSGLFPSQVNLVNVNNVHTPSILIEDQFDGREQNVFSVCFHPTQAYLAIGIGGRVNQKDAPILLWEIGASSPCFVRSFQTGLDSAEFVKFNPSGNHLAVADGISGTLKIMEFHSAPQPALKPVATLRSSKGSWAIQDIAWIDDSTWVAATNLQGLISTSRHGLQYGGLRNVKSKFQFSPFSKIPSSEITVLETLPGKHWIAIGANTRLESGQWHKGRILLGSTANGRNMKLQQANFDGELTAIAFSPDGDYVAAVGDDRYPGQSGVTGNVIRIWSTRTGKPLGQFPSKSQPFNGGCSIARVRVHSNSSENLSITFSRGTSASAPVQTFQLLQDDDQQPDGTRRFLKKSQSSLPVPQFRPRWDQQNGAYVFYLTNRLGEVGPFPLSSLLGYPVSERRFRVGRREFIAIGYRNRILVWDLAVVRQWESMKNRLPISRLENLRKGIVRGFSGHEGLVTSLDVSNDAKWLLSGSKDGTICSWSLQRITDPPRNRQELGVQFETRKNGRLFVKSVSDGIGKMIGLVAGQEVIGLTIPRPGVPENEWTVPQTKWKQALESPVPGFQHILTMRQKEKCFKVVTTGLQDPLWTFYPLMDNKNWVLWSPEGYFDASKQGTDFMGWQSLIKDENNRPTDVRFASARTFWESYYKPGPFDRFFQNGQKKSVLFQYIPGEPHTEETTEFPSDITITQITDTRHRIVSDHLSSPVDLKVTIRVKQVAEEQLSEIQLWCNSRLIQRIDDLRFPDPKIPDVLIKKENLREGANTITAVIGSLMKNGKTRYHTDAERLVVSRPSPRKPKLHFIGVGVTRMEHRKSWMELTPEISELKYTANDAYFLGNALERLSRKPGSKYTHGVFRYFLDPNSVNKNNPPPADFIAASPTKAHILQALEEMSVNATIGKRIEEKPQADDLLIILLAGHGFDDQGVDDLGLDPSEENLNKGFYFVAGDADTDLENAITRDEIFSRLNQIPCMKLLLIDACHSGGIQPGKAFHNLGGFFFGPQILVSCKENQTSLEHQQVRLDAKERNVGHGIFTAAFLEALTGRKLQLAHGKPGMISLSNRDVDVTRNGSLSVEELCLYVQKRVPQLRVLLSKLDRRAKPQDAPAVRKQTPQILSSLTLRAEKIELFSLAP